MLSLTLLFCLTVAISSIQAGPEEIVKACMGKTNPDLNEMMQLVNPESKECNTNVKDSTHAFISCMYTDLGVLKEDKSIDFSKMESMGNEKPTDKDMDAIMPCFSEERKEAKDVTKMHCCVMNVTKKMKKE